MKKQKSTESRIKLIIRLIIVIALVQFATTYALYRYLIYQISYSVEQSYRLQVQIDRLHVRIDHLESKQQ